MTVVKNLGGGGSLTWREAHLWLVHIKEGVRATGGGGCSMLLVNGTPVEKCVNRCFTVIGGGVQQ